MSAIRNPKRFAFVCLTLALFAGLALLSYVDAVRAAYAHFNQERAASPTKLCSPPSVVCSCQGNPHHACCPEGTCACDANNNPYCGQ